MDLKIEGKVGGEQKILIESENSVKLTRGQKGAYGWEIKVYGAKLEACVATVNRADEYMRKNYGGVDNGNATDTDVA